MSFILQSLFSKILYLNIWAKKEAEILGLVGENSVTVVLRH